MGNSGFKILTRQNWRARDPMLVNELISAGLTLSDYTPEDLVDDILHTDTLHQHIPVSLRELFEAARGAMCYGYFFYPVYTIACEQLFRVAEAAVALKCDVLGAPSSLSTFEKQIEHLSSIGLIGTSGWHEIRRARNRASHPRAQRLMSARGAVDIMRLLLAFINILFDDVQQLD